MISRRLFLRRAVLAVILSPAARRLIAWLCASSFSDPAHAAALEGPHEPLPALGRLTLDEWKIVRIIVDEIIPATDRAPSASRAGVLDYLDRALAGDYADQRSTYREIAAQVRKSARRRGANLSRALSPDLSLALTRDLEKAKPDLFKTVRGHTLEGYFSAPRHGGNRNCSGWIAVHLKSHIVPWSEVHPP